MKMLKKILGCKIYIWFAALIALVGLFFYWYGMNQNNNKSADSSQSYSMVKYIEATNETVFLNVGIEKVDALSNATKVLGITIPYSQKKAIIILNYEAKLGIKRAVSINKTRENNFEIKIPKFEVISVKLDDKHPYKLYRSGELLSGSTEEVDTGKAATSSLTNKEQKKYLKQYSDMIKKSAEDHYKVLFKSIYPDVKLTFVYEN
ncbi:DUF4230 domain-containing protein [Streptococcus mutans]|uniref:DUF4230 domain-containing protein n=1 Tax=Streptococcus mutans TaxID=1309 RepID=UPI0002D31F7F|nr:DUF4230 domain-containing protein [Streptococcus mutans]NLQ50425.1 DUF4230 domain-containing protein [Streptococcus mutans]